MRASRVAPFSLGFQEGHDISKLRTDHPHGLLELPHTHAQSPGPELDFTVITNVDASRVVGPRDGIGRNFNHGVGQGSRLSLSLRLSLEMSVSNHFRAKISKAAPLLK